MASTSANSSKGYIITQCFLDVDSVLSTVFNAKLSGFYMEQTLEDIFQMRLSSTYPPSNIRRNQMLLESYVDKQRSDGYPFGLEVDLDVPVAEIFREENMRAVTFIIKRLGNESQSTNVASETARKIKKSRKRTIKREIKDGEPEQFSLMQLDPAVLSQGFAIDAPSSSSTSSSSGVKNGNKQQESESSGSLNKIALKKRGRGWSRTKNTRGRPPNNKPDANNSNNNLLIPPDGIPKKRRGRPSGSKNRNTTVTVLIREKKKPGRKPKPKMMNDFFTEDREPAENITEKEPSVEPSAHYDHASAKLISASGLVPL